MSDTVRATMLPLIAQLRALTAASENEVEVNEVAYWTDLQLQQVLDQYSEDVLDLPLEVAPYREGGVIVYKRFYYPKKYRWLEETATVHNRFGVEAIDYEVVYHKSRVEFENPQVTAAYYLRASAYHLHDAAAEVWSQKAAHRYTLITWKAGQHTMQEQMEYEHCLQQAEKFRRRNSIRTATTVPTGFNRSNRWPQN